MTIETSTLWPRRTALLATLALLAGCAAEQQDTHTPSVDGARVEVVMHYHPQCGCCGEWADHMREEGFDVTLREEPYLNAKRRRLGVPDELASCHTAEVGGYLIEGHVPAGAVRRLLDERPEARGLSVPGMPIGSPGMEMGDRADEYAVILFEEDGSNSEFAQYRGHELQQP